jgi:hypothetical protein
MILGLVKGDFTYRDSGLLDPTHLRFFTFNTIQALFHDKGLKVDLLRPALPGKGH